MKESTFREKNMMKGHQIFIKTECGWKYYGKTPIFEQADNIRRSLEQQGYEVKIRNLASTFKF